MKERICNIGQPKIPICHISYTNNPTHILRDPFINEAPIYVAIRAFNVCFILS